LMEAGALGKASGFYHLLQADWKKATKTKQLPDGSTVVVRTDGFANAFKPGLKLTVFYECIKRRWLERHYNENFLRKVGEAAGAHADRSKLRARYSAENMERWKRIAAKIAMNSMKAKLAEVHVMHHEDRRFFSVGFFFSLQGRRDLYKKNKDGSFEELKNEDHARLVADGLFRTAKSVLSHPPTFNWRTVLGYVHEFDRWRGSFQISHQGQHAKTKWLLSDPKYQDKFVEYVKKEGERKGEKNLTAEELTRWVNDQLFLVGTPLALLTRPVNARTVTNWLHRLDFGFEKQAKAGYKDGAMSDEVLDYMFTDFLPRHQEFIDGGALMPSDFDGVTDLVDGRSQQAYEKARARAVTARGEGAKPYLLWSRRRRLFFHE